MIDEKPDPLRVPAPDGEQRKVWEAPHVVSYAVKDTAKPAYYLEQVDPGVIGPS